MTRPAPSSLSTLSAPLEPQDPARDGADKGGRLADLGPRFLSGLVMVCLALATLRIGGDIFVTFWLVAALAMDWEWQRLVGGARGTVRFLCGSVALVLAAVAASRTGFEVAVVVLVLAGGAIALAAGAERRVWAAGGVFYAGVLVISVCVLRLSFPFGNRSILWLFAIVWGTDICAYFIGRLLGGPKFWPRVSPSKTWSGTLGGVVGGALLGLLCLAIAARATGLGTPSGWLPLFLIGLLLAAASQGGDMFESWVKRRFGVKDSSRLIPGHGGVMDRLDGFVAAVVCAAIIGGLHGFPSAAEGLLHWL